MIYLKDIELAYRMLYPTGRAWHFTNDSSSQVKETVYYVDGVDDNFIDGASNKFYLSKEYKELVNGIIKVDASVFFSMYEEAEAILDQMFPDNENFTEIDLENNERVYGIRPSSSLSIEEREQILINKMKNGRGVVERCHYSYLEEELRNNGFDVYVHENRFLSEITGTRVGSASVGSAIVGHFSGGDGFIVKELFPYTELCSDYIEAEKDAGIYNRQDRATVGSKTIGSIVLADEFPFDRKSQLANTIMIGGETYPDFADVPQSRKREFRELILKTKPAHITAALYINYI